MYVIIITNRHELYISHNHIFLQAVMKPPPTQPGLPNLTGSSIPLSSFIVKYFFALLCDCVRLSVVTLLHILLTPFCVPAGSPSRGGDVTVYGRHKPTEFAHSFFLIFFNSVLVSISVFVILSAVFHSINSPDNSPFSHSLLPVLSLTSSSFQLYISL